MVSNVKIEKSALKITEEVFNSLTHGIGAVLGVIGLIIGLFTISATADINISYIVYGVCLIILMVVSSLYHALFFTKARNVFKILDHSGIYLLIAGSYTPLVVYLYSGWAQVIILSLIWALAIAGVVFKASMPVKMAKYSMTLYIGLGWLALFLIPKLLSLPNIVLYLIILGGVLYTIGASLLAFKKPFVHVAWHVFVVAAATAHFFAITILV